METQSQYLTSFQRKLLQKSLQTDLRPEYRRRIEIMLMADQGLSRSQISKAVGCAPETARYWIAIAQAGNAHLWETYSIGRPKVANPHYCDRLKELVTRHPREYGYPFQRWTANWLSKQLAKELGITVNDRHINRLLKQMRLSTRTQFEQTESLFNSPQGAIITIYDLSSSTLPDVSVSSALMLPNIHGSMTKSADTRTARDRRKALLN